MNRVAGDIANLPCVSPLGVTPSEFAAAHRDVTGIGPALALEEIKSLLRTGAWSGRTALSNVPQCRWLPALVAAKSEQSPEGTVTKFLLRVPGTDRIKLESATSDLPAGLDTESVLIPMIGQMGKLTYTLCVSSQVGCAMGCTFCETAQMGLIRSLTAEEIVAQWFTATHVLGQRPSNIVFMGMGEPLDNLTNVLRAIEILIDHNGAAVPVSKITISTVGRVDGLRELAKKVNDPGWRRLNIALSLNAAIDATRDAIMPINRKWNLDELRRAFQEFPRYGGGKLMFEYVLIPGVNDSEADAKAVAEFVQHFRLADGRHRVCLNLIPYNPRRNSPWPAPTEERVEWFMQQLMDGQVFVKRRRTKGRTMMGACGQLGNEQIRKRQVVAEIAEPVGLTVDGSRLV
jgi:23S rRNA (adenine2503-C2)-methyltransferase